MAECRWFNSVYSSRYVYNSNYVDVQLFDVQQVKKMLAMYRYTKPNILFSDVVKKKPVSDTVKSCVNTNSMKAKIGLGKSNQQSGNHNVVHTCVDKHKDKNTVKILKNVLIVLLTRVILIVLQCYRL